MLRTLVAALLLANLAFFAWTQGWLDRVVGVAVQGEREPERLARQIQPDVLTVVPATGAASDAAAAASAGLAASASAVASTSPSFADAAASATAAGPATFGLVAVAPAASGAAVPASVGTSSAASDAAADTALACFEAGPFVERDLPAAQATLGAAIPAGRWNRLKVDRPGIWIVYMGRFPDRPALQKKEEELRRFAGLVYEEVKTPASLAPGLALGRFDSRDGARDALAALTERGVKTARVMSIRPPAVVDVLQVERVDPTLAATLASLKLGALRKGFVPCIKR